MSSQAQQDRGVASPVPSRIFYGWVIAGIAFAAQFVSNAAGLSIIGNLMTPISAEFGVSRSLVGIAPGVSILVIGLLGPFIGRLVDAGYVRRVMVVGGLLNGLGLIGLSYAQTFGQAAASFVLLAAPGLALYGMMPAMALVANWFVRRRGLALGIAVAGATISAGVGPNAFELIAAEQGWRGAIFVFGAITAALSIPLFGGLVIARPEDIGLRPDGDPEPASEDAAASGPAPRTSAELAKIPALWIQAVGFGLILTSPVVLIAVLVPFSEDLGMTAAQGSRFFIWMIPFSLAGKLVIGGLADVTPLKPGIALMVVVNAIVWWMLGQSPDYDTLMIIGAIYGVGIGGMAPLHGVLIGRLFGRVDYGTASGLGGIVGVSLIVLASFGSQGLYAVTESYPQVCRVQMALVLIGGAVVALLRIPSPAEAS
ncbi:MAG: MFS transporter [Myxococcota bacterium]